MVLSLVYIIQNGRKRLVTYDRNQYLKLCRRHCIATQQLKRPPPPPPDRLKNLKPGKANNYRKCRFKVKIRSTKE